MRKHINTILTVATTLIVTLGYAQSKQNDTLNTGVIDIVKPYAPSISDAFKVKETPVLDDAVTETKKDIKYNIFSFPVASTFTPSKGTAAAVEKAKPIKLYDNYATLGVGNYTTILGEVYLNHAISRNESIGGYVSHHSSGGDVDDVQFDSGFSDSKINVNYANRTRYLEWNLDGGFQFQKYNWYGVPEGQVLAAQADNIDVAHTYHNAHFGGDISFQDTYINSGSVFYRRFGDNQGSGENRFTAKGKVDVPIRDEEISTEIKIDYLGGSFDQDFNNVADLKYSYFQLGVMPSYQLIRDDLTLNLGIAAHYLNDSENGTNKFYLYPNVTASYRLASDVVIAYGGLQGDLKQNSYYDFATENPYVSPTLAIAPTDQQYNAYLGLKGKITSHIGYNISGSYASDKNKALYQTNAVRDYTDQRQYDFGNSYGIVYDNISTLGISGEINVDINRNFNLGIKAEYFSYDTDAESEAWNLPEVKGNLFLDYQIDQNWFAGANLFYTGERQDLLTLQSATNPTTTTMVTLDSYFDANAHVGYHINEQISVFAKANNIANNNYERWQNTPVQGLQLLAGATFKFDF